MEGGCSAAENGDVVRVAVMLSARTCHFGAMRQHEHGMHRWRQKIWVLEIPASPLHPVRPVLLMSAFFTVLKFDPRACCWSSL